MSTQLLTVAEVAERLRCGRTHVYDLIARGELPVVDLGLGRAKSRIREDDLAAFIDSRTRSTA